MKRMFLAVMLGVAVAQVGIAQPCSKGAPEAERLGKLLDDAHVSRDAVIVAFDHDEHCWAVVKLEKVQVKQPGSAASEKTLLADVPVEFDINGVPQLQLSAGSSVVPVVFHTNAGLYVATRLEAKESAAANAELAAKFAKLLGGLAGAVVAQKAEKTAPFEAKVLVMDVETSATPTPAKEKATPAPKPLPGRLSAELEQATHELRNALDGFGGKGGVGSRIAAIKALAKRAQTLVDYVQRVEDGGAALQPVYGADPVLLFDKKALDPIEDPVCVDTLTLVRGALLDRSRRANAVTSARAVVAIGASRRNEGKDCERFEDGLKDVEAWLRAADPATKEVGEAVGWIDAYLAAVADVQTANGRLAALLDKWEDLLTGAVALKNAEERVKKTCPAPDRCDLLLVEGPYTKTKWDKTGTGKFKIEVGTALETTVSRKPSRKADLEVSYVVDWRGARILGLGFGITYVNLVDREFGLVPDPVDATKKVVGTKKETTRAGQLAMFLSLFPLELPRHGSRTVRWVRPSVDLGVGLSGADSASLFTGVGVELFRCVRLGGGLTLQKVHRLVPGQSAVESADDIRTRTGWDRGGYASLVIAIDSLPFFKPD
jgi:hypothetical protein